MNEPSCPYCKAIIKKEDSKGNDIPSHCPVCGNTLFIGVLDGKLVVQTVR